MINSIEKAILVDILNNPGDTFYENVLSDFLDEQNIEHDFRKPLHNNNFITKLKPYQEKCLEIWVNHWLSISICTRPTDESKA
jgi:superfamily II DNA or RNA helicase